jgi:hypothetical protein
MLKRRLKQARLPAHYSPHSFRATGITNFLENDGTLEAKFRRQTTEGPDKPELRGDDVNGETEPSPPRELEAVLGFTLHLR